ncbi:MAG: hypothetical protein DLM65_12210, partial [Candidatus Aeolococcus gillhamiae]
MPSPTGEDAHIYLQLLDLAMQPTLLAATDWVVFEFAAASHAEFEKKYPGGTDRSQLVSVLGFYESVGALVSRGLLHEDLFFDAPFRFDLVWDRVESLVVDWQKSSKDPAVWENVIWLARRHDAWRKSTWRLKSEAIPTDRPPSKQWGETQGHVGFTK